MTHYISETPQWILESSISNIVLVTILNRHIHPHSLQLRNLYSKPHICKRRKNDALKWVKADSHLSSQSAKSLGWCAEDQFDPSELRYMGVCDNCDGHNYRVTCAAFISSRVRAPDEEPNLEGVNQCIELTKKG